MAIDLGLHLVDRFTAELPPDPVLQNRIRQVEESAYSYVEPQRVSNPKLLHVSVAMAEALGLRPDQVHTPEFLEVFSGNALLKDSHPYAMCYGGHQFGSWAGQLGDGRAINLGELEHAGKHWALQLKGAGKTPYSRRADGLAVLRSSIREYLCSEAMHHLGVPTTRALSLVSTGEQVMRDMLYDGNPEWEPGAVVCRVAPSFVRFGNFEIFAAREDDETLRKLTDHVLKHFYPHLGTPSKEAYLALFAEVAQRSRDMVLHWQRVGFVHGVMNTDNMSILGLTIDYGPYGWLDDFDPGWTPNTTDAGQKRYRYGAQPNIVLWNLSRLANALYPLIGETQGLEAVLKEFAEGYFDHHMDMMRSKLGLQLRKDEDAGLMEELENCLLLLETDMTLFYRLLSRFDDDNPKAGVELIQPALYQPEKVTADIQVQWEAWFMAYSQRLGEEPLAPEARAKAMDAVNPKYVLRNYMAQMAIDAAEKGDLSVLNELFELLKNPYEEQPQYQKWFAKRPEWARHKVGCSMLSCSS